MRYDTYANWRAAGYQVIKGCKSEKRDEHGVPLFHSDQVKVRHTRYSGILPGGNSDHGSGDWDEDPGYSDLDIGCFQ